MRLPSLLVPLALAACADGATARLGFDNQTAARTGPGLLADGTSLRLKIIAAYLAEDVDPVTMNNLGDTAMIWLNPQCADDISGCNVSGMRAPVGGPRVTDFFDLARPTAEINAALNAQGAAVPVGTYRYARIEMCKSYDGQAQPDEPTLMWAAPGMAAEQPFTSGDCGRTSQPFATPLVLGAGDTVAIFLGYDLASSVASGPGLPQCANGHCFRSCFDIDATTRACMDFPDFAPTAALDSGTATAVPPTR